MKELIAFGIYFEDLTEAAQHDIRKKFGTVPRDTFPVIISNEEEIEAEEKEKS